MMTSNPALKRTAAPPLSFALGRSIMKLRQISTALIACVTLYFAGCASPNLIKQEPVDHLVGCWYGEDYQPVFQRKAGWLMNRKSDGTFTIEFRTVERGLHLPIQTEEGRWTYQNGKYTTATTNVAGESIDTSDPQYTDEYEVMSLSDTEMIYYHPGVKQTFVSKKVVCEYKAP